MVCCRRVAGVLQVCCIFVGVRCSEEIKKNLGLCCNRLVVIVIYVMVCCRYVAGVLQVCCRCIIGLCCNRLVIVIYLMVCCRYVAAVLQVYCCDGTQQM